MFASIIKWVLSSGLDKVAGSLASAYVTKKTSTDELGKARAEVDIAQLEARQRSLLNGTSNIARLVQFFTVFPGLFHLNKTVLWDGIMGWGTTSAMSSFEEKVFFMGLGYFLLSQAGTVAYKTINKK
jgi:hypothetical protein